MSEMGTPKNEFEGAQIILKRYYHHLVRQIAEEIIQAADTFETPSWRGADDLVEKYACQLSRLGTVYTHLSRFVSSELPAGTEPLGKDDFRCFGCGGVIRREENECRLCGWTWK